MRTNLTFFLEFGFRLIVLFLIILLSLKIDRFAFGMLNAKNFISSGLGVSLFLANNIVCLILIIKFSNSTFKNYFPNQKK